MLCIISPRTVLSIGQSQEWDDLWHQEDWREVGGGGLLRRWDCTPEFTAFSDILRLPLVDQKLHEFYDPLPFRSTTGFQGFMFILLRYCTLMQRLLTHFSGFHEDLIQE